MLKRIFTSIMILFLVLSVKCIMASAAAAASYTLTVTNGSGTGTYQEGSAVHVSADPSEALNLDATTIEPLDTGFALRIFDRWVGDTNQVVDVFSPETDVIIPAGDVYITAMYKDTPRWGLPNVITYFANPRVGVIFLLHGAGSCAACMISDINKIAFIRDAVSRGYSVVIPESYDRKTKMWDLALSSAENVDIQRIAALRQDLIIRGQMSTSDPVYMVGMSGGGIFASLFDGTVQQELGFPVRAEALYASPGHFSVISTTTVPTVFIANTNDTIMPLSSLVTSFDMLVQNEVPTQLLVNGPIPLSPRYFWQIDGISAYDSEAIYDALESAGFLDAQGYLIENPNNSNWESVIPSDFVLFIQQIQNLLNVAYAEHTFPATVNHQVFTFLENPTTVIDLKPTISDFTPTSGTAGTSVTIYGSNFIDIQSVSFNGTAANFNQITSTKIITLVPEGANTGPISITGSSGSVTTQNDFVVLTKPVINSLSPTKGPVGSNVVILGENLSGVISVTFSGVEASFTLESNTQINAVVPPGVSGWVLVRSATPVAKSNGKIFIAR